MNQLAHTQNERERGHGQRSLFSVLTLLISFNPEQVKALGLQRNPQCGLSVIALEHKGVVVVMGGLGGRHSEELYLCFPIVKQPSGRKVATTNITNQALRLKVETRK